MYSLSAKYYDALYDFKDYQGEANKLVELVHRFGSFAGQKDETHAPALLDVACGTGRHLEFLRRTYTVEGLDLNPDLLAAARQRNPGIPFYEADMENFNFSKKFEIITCLFSAVGYLKTSSRILNALRCMSSHLCLGGILLLEPWLTPAVYKSDTLHATFVDRPDLKIARITHSRRQGQISVLEMEYLVGTPEKTEHFTEVHELGLFEPEEMRALIQAAELTARYDEQGLTGRGIWIGLKTGL